MRPYAWRFFLAAATLLSLAGCKSMHNGLATGPEQAAAQPAQVSADRAAALSERVSRLERNLGVLQIEFSRVSETVSRLRKQAGLENDEGVPSLLRTLPETASPARIADVRPRKGPAPPLAAAANNESKGEIQTAANTANIQLRAREEESAARESTAEPVMARIDVPPPATSAAANDAKLASATPQEISAANMPPTDTEPTAGTVGATPLAEPHGATESFVAMSEASAGTDDETAEGGPEFTPETEDAIGIHLASYRQIGYLRTGWSRLTKEHAKLLESLSPHMSEIDIPARGKFFRLIAGPLPDAETAQTRCDELEAHGMDHCTVMPFPPTPMPDQG